MRYTTTSRNSNEPRRTKQCIGVAGVVLLTKQSFPATAMIAVVRRSTNAAIVRLQIPCSNGLTFVVMSIHNANNQCFGSDHIGSKTEPRTRSTRTDHRDRKNDARTQSNNPPAPQKLALTFIGRYTYESIVGCFGHVKPQPKTDEPKNAPKLRVRSFPNVGPIPRNVGDFRTFWHQDLCVPSLSSHRYLRSSFCSYFPSDPKPFGTENSI